VRRINLTPHADVRERRALRRVWKRAPVGVNVRRSMQHGKGSQLFLLFVACAAVFVWVTGLTLPNLVASHFGAEGAANGFMPRSFYIGFMLVVIIGLPALLVVVTWFALGSSSARINLPNRDYWLAPERRTETLATLIWLKVLFGRFRRRD
jgi:hypothetical protein